MLAPKYTQTGIHLPLRDWIHSVLELYCTDMCYSHRNIYDVKFHLLSVMIYMFLNKTEACVFLLQSDVLLIKSYVVVWCSCRRFPSYRAARYCAVSSKIWQRLRANSHNSHLHVVTASKYSINSRLCISRLSELWVFVHIVANVDIRYNVVAVYILPLNRYTFSELLVCYLMC